MSHAWDAKRLTDLANAYWSSCALHAAVRTGLAAELAKGPASLERLASRLGLSPRGLEPLLTSLLTLGLLGKQGDAYHLNPEAAPFLDPASPHDLSNLILHMADMVPTWAELDRCVRTGKPVEREQEPYNKQTPQRRHFYRAMRDLARQQAPDLAARLGLKPGQRLLDLGGGPGVYAYTFAAEVPGLRVTVFDLPGARPHFEQEAAAHPGAKGVEFQEGDYRRDELGGPYDVVWLSQVLHGEGPDECQRLVQKAAAALGPGGVLWIQEFVVDPQGKGHPFAALFSLNMLVNTPAGRSYTARELDRFMTRAGLERTENLGPVQEGSPAMLLRGFKPA